MSPRKNRRRASGPQPPPPSSTQATESGPDGEWVVRRISGAATAKSYRCPGCDQEIRPGVGHVVAWRAEPRGADDRRHWHTPCWSRRLHRAPRTPRARNAPRYG